MTKYEYLIELAKKLEALNINSDDIYPETRRLVGFYQEMIEDRMEEGISEEEAVAGMEKIEDIVARVKREFATPEIVVGPDAPVEPEAPEAPAEPGTTARAEGKYTYMTKTYDPAEVRRVTVVDQNRSVNVVGGDCLKIEYVDGPDGHYEVDCQGGALNVRFIADPWGGFRSIFGVRTWQTNPFTLTLPKEYSGEVDARTSNGSMSAARTGANVLSLRTSNGKITAESVAAQRARFTTTNGGIRLRDVAAHSVVAESSNARIESEGVEGDEVILKTSNGANEARGVTAKRVKIETRNGHLSVESVTGDDISLSSSNGGISGTISGRMADYAISSRTSNGKNNLPPVSEGKKKLEVRTSNARIDIQFEK